MRKDTAEKMWEAFKTFFAREFQEIRVQPRTSASKGYGANCMRGGHANTAERDDMQQHQAEALANLAIATAADRQAVTSLSSSNATLTQELRTATSTIATLQQRLDSCSCVTTPQTGARGQQRRQASQQRQNNPGRDTTSLDPNGYCWSHGYRISMVHNGASCYYTLPGHQRTATRADPIGGSTKNKP